MNAFAKLALALGGLLVLLGVAGLFVHPTLLVFGVNRLHNALHLATGVVLLAAALARGGAHARLAALGVGGAYAALALLEVVAPGTTIALFATEMSVFPYADALLHLALALALLAGAFGLRTGAAADARR